MPALGLCQAGASVKGYGLSGDLAGASVACSGPQRLQSDYSGCLQIQKCRW